MYFRYGAWTAPANEVNLTSFEIIPRFSDRRVPYAVEFRMHLVGQIVIQNVDQDAISTRIGEVADAFSTNGHDATLFQDDGTATRHRLINDGGPNIALSDVQVAYRSWPKGKPEEYANTRTYSVILRQLVAASELPLLRFMETIEIIGTAGPVWESVRYRNQTAGQDIVYTTSTQQVVQSGHAYALLAWPDQYVPDPVLPLWEHEEVRLKKRIYPIWSGTQYYNFGREWRYLMETPAGVDVEPTLV